MNACFITTIDHNVGDDFVREGILYLLEAVLPEVTPTLIHKHFPVTVRPELEWIHSKGLASMIDRLPKVKQRDLSGLLDRIPINRSTDKILNADLVVQSGAPVYWLNPPSKCSNNEWYAPLVKRRFSLRESPPILFNVGAGSCQPFYSSGEEFLADDEVVSYIQQLHAQSRLTTVRDRVARNILRMMKIDAPLLPCPSLFASRRLSITPQPPEYVAINFMPRGGHYDLGERTDTLLWENTFSAFYHQLVKESDCLFVCHSNEEVEAAVRIDPKARTFFNADYHEYLRTYSRASVGVTNRIHGAFAVASFGRPCVVIGNDSRSHMVEELGLKALFVNEASPDQLYSAYRAITRSVEEYQKKIDLVSSSALEEYLALFRRALS